MLLFILLGGYNPFDPGGDSADPVIEKRVLSNQWAFDPECFGSVSKEAKDLITKLLSTAPERRPTSSDLLANKWVMGSASAAPLPASDKRLKMFNDLRRSWRAAIGAIELITILPTAADKDQLKLRTFQSTNPDYDPKKPLSPDALAELRVSFDSFDTANSGTISMAELLSKFKALGASEEEANGVMELIDSHHTGDISFDEFASAIGPLMASRKSSALKRAFDRFDTDGSGKIDRNELQSMLVKLGWNADDTKVDEMMRIADQTGDGQISFDEFKTLLDCEAAQKRMDSKTAS